VSVPRKRKPLPFDGYIRVSDTRGRLGSEDFISPDVQEAAINRWSARTGHPVLMCEPEFDKSGRTMERPIFEERMERIRRGVSAGIVVYKSDRFARTTLGALFSLAEIAEHGGTFASAEEPDMDYTTPAGMAFLQMLFVFNQFFSATIKEGWATSQTSADVRGKHISPYEYLGYTFGPDGRLVPNEWRDTAVEVFRRRAGGQSWQAIADWLNSIGAPVPLPRKLARGEESKRRPAAQWTAVAVGRLVEKRVYLGEASRYINQNRDDRDPVVNADAHPALVDTKLWLSAQRKPRLSPVVDPESPLLSGIVRCSGCRYRMSKGKGGAERIDLMRCRRRHASGTCRSPASISLEPLTEYVEAMVIAQLDGETELVPDSAERDAAAEAVSVAREDFEGFREDRAARRKLGPAWHDWLDDYLRAVAEAEAELERLDGLIGAVEGGLTRDHYLALSTADRRQVLGEMIDAVFVRRSKGRGAHVDPIETRVLILWRGEAPADLPRTRVVNDIRPFAWPEDGVIAGVLPPQDGA
jgi:DNA invertase Pin-like site-specific DNA recombinase